MVFFFISNEDFMNSIFQMSVATITPQQRLTQGFTSYPHHITDTRDEHGKSLVTYLSGAEQKLLDRVIRLTAGNREGDDYRQDVPSSITDMAMETGLSRAWIIESKKRLSDAGLISYAFTGKRGDKGTWSFYPQNAAYALAYYQNIKPLESTKSTPKPKTAKSDSLTVENQALKVQIKQLQKALSEANAKLESLTCEVKPLLEVPTEIPTSVVKKKQKRTKPIETVSTTKGKNPELHMPICRLIAIGCKVWHVDSEKIKANPDCEGTPLEGTFIAKVGEIGKASVALRNVDATVEEIERMTQWIEIHWRNNNGTICPADYPANLGLFREYELKSANEQNKAYRQALIKLYNYHDELSVEQENALTLIASKLIKAGKSLEWVSQFREIFYSNYPADYRLPNSKEMVAKYLELEMKGKAQTKSNAYKPSQLVANLAQRVYQEIPL